MTRKIITVTVMVAVAIGVYFFAIGGGNEAPKKLETQEIKQLVQDYTLGNREAESASINSKQLVVTESETSQVSYDLPEDEFFVSIAPYVETTHPCANHNLTGCQGEMINKEFDVYIEDSQGKVIVNETMQSEANGFIDLWLPRDQTYQVIISHEGKTVEQEISTFKNDNTCVTTMQLV